MGKIPAQGADEQSMETSTHGSSTGSHSGPSSGGSVPVPARASGPASLRRVASEGDVELIPERSREAKPRLRIVGPGRRERAYQDSIAHLEQQAAEKEAALQAARLVERGTARFVDRLEREREADRDRLQEVQAQGNRLLVAMGAMQRENERLAGELHAVRGRIEARQTSGLRGLLSRLLHGRLLR